MHAHVAPVLCRVISVLYLHLLNCVHVGPDVRDGNEVVHDCDSIERQAIRDFPLAGPNEIFTRRNTCLIGLRPYDDI